MLNLFQELRSCFFYGFPLPFPYMWYSLSLIFCLDIQVVFFFFEFHIKSFSLDKLQMAKNLFGLKYHISLAYILPLKLCIIFVLFGLCITASVFMKDTLNFFCTWITPGTITSTKLDEMPSTGLSTYKCDYCPMEELLSTPCCSDWKGLIISQKQN